MAFESAVAAAGGWPSLLRLPLGEPAPLPEYCSPKVRVGSADGAGRGLFVDAPCVAGEVLLLAPAFAVAPVLTGEGPSSNAATAAGRSAASLVQAVVVALEGTSRRNLELLLSLRHEAPADADSDGADTEREIAALQSLLLPIGPDAKTVTVEDLLAEAEFQSAEALVRRCKEVVNFNGREAQKSGSMWTAPVLLAPGPPLTPAPVMGPDKFRPGVARPRSAASGDVAASMYGLWLVPSLMNHSCSPSCAFWVCGTTLCVRAARQLKRGEELTDAYTDILCAEPVRRPRLVHFSCGCPRCSCERRIPKWLETATEMSRRLLETNRGSASPEAALKRLEALWDELTREAASAAAQLETATRAVGSASNAFPCWLMAALFELPFHAAAACQLLKRPREAAKWMQQAGDIAEAIWPNSPCVLDCRALQLACLSLEDVPARTNSKKSQKATVAAAGVLTSLAMCFARALGGSSQEFERWLLNDRLGELPDTWVRRLREWFRAPDGKAAISAGLAAALAHSAAANESPPFRPEGLPASPVPHSAAHNVSAGAHAPAEGHSETSSVNAEFGTLDLMD